MPRTRITVQVPRAASSGGGGSSAGLAGPYLTQYLTAFPTGDGTTFVFGIYGLGDADTVEWSASLGEYGSVPFDRYDAHTLIVVDNGGESAGGTVTATVNGTELDTLAFGPP